MNTRTGAAGLIETASIDELRSRMRGPLLLPGDPGFDESRSLWNAMIDRRPALIARCIGVADVIHGVNFARERRLPLSIKGGGHNIAGLAVCDGGLMLDMSLMRGVWVDPTASRARAQAGCLLGDVDRETQVHGLAAVLGFVSNTGIAGLTLGGGFGYLTRRFGWCSDNVVAMEMVTADSKVVRASEQENADLFWALRGGGGNFGVVTGFDYRLHPLGPEVMAGVIAWPFDKAHQVLDLVRTLNERAPALTCAAVLRIAPPAPWLAKEIHGRPIIALAVCYAGSVREGEEATAALKALGSTVGDVLQRRPYVTQQSILDATQPKGRRYYWKSEYLRALDPEVIERAIEHAAHLPSPHSAVVLFPVGGAIQTTAEDHSAAGNRDARWVLNITASWEAAAGDQANIEWARAAWRDMRRFSTGGTYVNFLTEEEGDERIRASYGANYERLVALKTTWDPENLFQMNKNIAPR
jgi:FAD/FMN-containing dehydrogenase